MKRSKSEKRAIRKARRIKRRERWAGINIKVKGFFTNISKSFKPERSFDADKWQDEFNKYWGALRFFLAWIGGMKAFSGLSKSIDRIIEVGDAQKEGFETELTARVRGVLDEIVSRLELAQAFAPVFIRDEIEYFIDLLEWIAEEEKEIEPVV